MTSSIKLGSNHTLIQEMPWLTVRPIRPSDLALISEMHQRLSPESIYYRYLQYRTPSLEELRAVCQMEPGKGAGFVATVQAGAERIVGIAYYVREAVNGLPTAELGILIEDQFQGQRIGRRLWTQLHEHAMANQIRQLRVLCEPGNWRMRLLLQGSGLTYQINANDWLNEYLVTLEEQPQPSPMQRIVDWLGQRLLVKNSMTHPRPSVYTQAAAR